MPPLVSFSFRVRLAIVYFYAFTGLGSDLLNLGLFLTLKTQLRMDSKEFGGDCMLRLGCVYVHFLFSVR